MKTNSFTVAIAASAALALGGCSSDGGGDTGALAPIKTVPVGYSLLAVAGHGAIVAMSDSNGDSAFPGSPEQGILRILGHPAGSPTELSPIGTPILGCGGDLAVTAEWVTGYGGYGVCAVSLGGATPALVATIVPGDVVVRAMAARRWLVIARTTWNGPVLEVRDLQAPDLGFPRVGDLVPAGADVTGLLEVPEGFLVFTSGGYGRLDLTGGVPAYAFTASDDLRLFERGCARDGIALVGGPSPVVGKSRVGRVDLSVAAAPSLAAHADVDGTFEDFACDGGTAVTLASTAVSTRHGPSTLLRASVHRDQGGALVLGAIVELAGLPYGDSASQIHLSEGILYAPYMPDPYVSRWSAVAMFPVP